MTIFQPDIEEVLNTDLDPTTDMFFKLKSARALEDETFEVVFRYIFKFKLNIEGALGVLSPEKLESCATLAIQAKETTQENLLYAHYILVNLSLCELQLQVQNSLKFIEENIDKNLLPFIDDELRLILEYTKTEAIEFENIPPNEEVQKDYVDIPVLPPLDSAGRLIGGLYRSLNEYEVFCNLIATRNPDVDNIHRRLLELTNDLREFTFFLNFPISRTEFVKSFVDYILIAFEIPTPNNLLFVFPYSNILDKIREEYPRYNHVSINFKSLQEPIVRLITCAADINHNLDYYMIAAYLTMGHMSMSYMLDVLTLSFYNKNQISDEIAVFGFDICHMNGYKGYFATLMQFLSKEHLEIAKKPFFACKPVYFGESIPYLFKIPLFFSLFDEKENDLLYIDPRGNKTIKLLLATQYKQQELYSASFDVKCIHLFLNDLSRKFHTSRRQPFPESK
ncbi:hypothetical protein TVAG_193310 [Trichomonas vaginalis G3]|uniref:Uncharacterized protein n=1 Tax=Trichomonas vaginalis (strain ATCC PRA-98 / G3) TaxID=412133 RepID=A2DH45_TRIV3|nr:hypothetical protein TVAGG3_0341260 [Trichomonas vaginalis G3]EAY20355.1 hypothetical protein TVAG_193310 [Trichomonas vaginalis G3]KAI5530654.1 hypothetical protein TVAGG3_0341260 [Trichomonas vaginalis G3]|eukprot:XP_001581341.1 hypothetical protein [Trichomonas vaginalis G3]